jgi:hypothetical protein
LNVTNNKASVILTPTNKEDFALRVKFITEKEVAIEEDTEFRRDFLNNLASLLTESSFKNDAVPFPSNTDIIDTTDLDVWNKALNFTEYYECVIKNLEKVFTILNAVSNNYHILRFIPGTADDKIDFMIDLESHFHFINLPSSVSLVLSTIIKK